MPSFADLLKLYRTQANLSQRELAARANVNAAIISRMESGDRGASGPEQALALARALGLDQRRSDALLASAGFWPEAILALGPQDPTLLAVARVLAGAQVSEPFKLWFRQVVESLADRWLDAPAATPAASGEPAADAQPRAPRRDEATV